MRSPVCAWAGPAWLIAMASATADTATTSLVFAAAALVVVPAKAGTHLFGGTANDFGIAAVAPWVPAFAGTTRSVAVGVRPLRRAGLGRAWPIPSPTSRPRLPARCRRWRRG